MFLLDRLFSDNTEFRKILTQSHWPISYFLDTLVWSLWNRKMWVKCLILTQLQELCLEIWLNHRITNNLISCSFCIWAIETVENGRRDSKFISDSGVHMVYVVQVKTIRQWLPIYQDEYIEIGILHQYFNNHWTWIRTRTRTATTTQFLRPRFLRGSWSKSPFLHWNF